MLFVLAFCFLLVACCLLLVCVLFGVCVFTLCRGSDSQDNGAGLGNIEDKSKSCKSINAFEQLNAPDGGDWRQCFGGRA